MNLPNDVATPSRLPAGSTLEISPGVHVPHPHAEVNLPGAGDPRLGNSAVTEFFTHTVEVSSEDKPETTFVRTTVEQKPLADEVKPKVLTVASGAKPVALPNEANVVPVSEESPGAVAVEEPTLKKTE